MIGLVKTNFSGRCVIALNFCDPSKDSGQRVGINEAFINIRRDVRRLFHRLLSLHA